MPARIETSDMRVSSERRRAWLGFLLGVIAVACFSLTLPASRYAVPAMHPVFVGSGRAVVAGMLAIVFLLFMRGSLPNLRQLMWMLAAAPCVALIFPVFTAWAMLTVPSSHGGILLGILPLTTSLFGMLLARERPSVFFWLTALLGALLVIFYALIRGEDNFVLHWGDLLLIIAVIAAGIGYTVGTQLSKELGGTKVICWLVIVALPLNIPLAWIFRPAAPLSLDIGTWGAFLYVALVSQFFAFFFWYRALAIGGIARVSQTQLLQPFMTLAASAFLLRESPSVVDVLFAVLIIATVFVNRRTSVRLEVPS